MPPVFPLLVLALLFSIDQGRGAQQKPAPPPQPFTTNLTASDMTNKQAVVNTSAGTFVIGLRPDLAPNHVGHFMCVTEQTALTGKYTIFGRVSEGLDVVQKISEVAASPEGIAQERIEIVSVAIRDTPPPEPEAFSTESVAELAAYRAVLETTSGPITIAFLPGSATTSFFIVVGQASSLDRKYTVFGRVEDGMAAVEAIEKTPVNGETPVGRIEVTRVRLVK